MMNTKQDREVNVVRHKVYLLRPFGRVNSSSRVDVFTLRHVFQFRMLLKLLNFNDQRWFLNESVCQF